MADEHEPMWIHSLVFASSWAYVDDGKARDDDADFAALKEAAKRKAWEVAVDTFDAGGFASPYDEADQDSVHVFDHWFSSDNEIVYFDVRYWGDR